MENTIAGLELSNEQADELVVGQTYFSDISSGVRRVCQEIYSSCGP